MSSKHKQLRQRVERIERELFPYLYQQEFYLYQLEEYMWLKDPEEFRKRAEETNKPSMLAIMKAPIRRDRERFVQWGDRLLAQLPECYKERSQD